MKDFDTLRFNIFDFMEKVNNRKKVLPLMTLNAIYQLGIIEGTDATWSMDEEKLGNFLNKAQGTYF